MMVVLFHIAVSENNREKYVHNFPDYPKKCPTFYLKV